MYNVPEIPKDRKRKWRELQEHANLLAAVQMRKVRPKKKMFSRNRIEKRFGKITKYIYLFPSEKCTQMKFKNLIELVR